MEISSSKCVFDYRSLPWNQSRGFINVELEQIRLHEGIDRNGLLEEIWIAKGCRARTLQI